MSLLMKAALTALLATSVLHPARAGDAGFTGRWELTTSYAGGSYTAGLDLTRDAERYAGRSVYLVPDFQSPYRFTGAVQPDGLHLQVLGPDGTTIIGRLVLKEKNGVLSGTGTLHDVRVSLSGRRPLTRPANAPTVHDFVPTVFYRNFSKNNPPALHIFSGDTVRTETLDAYGIDSHSVQRYFGGNPQTGPFYVEGAMIGDTIAVHFNKIRPNRDTATQYRGSLVPAVLPPGYRQERTAGWSNLWKLDREHGTATPDQPSEKLKNLKIRIVPMLGCVAVAPHLDESPTTSHLGAYGGNMDYNQIQEGTTLYLPVYQAGALLTVGDGHAFQADGEITAQGLETSMDVEFTVELLRDQSLLQPWAENDRYIMVSGIAASLNDALQLATAGLVNWLKSFYGLNGAEVATVLASSIHYDIAEVGADPEAHVVAKLEKAALSQIPKPEGATRVFCQPESGCAPN